ncbi:NBS-LRR type resistance protein [Cucumis melo var. makuwa]|uniref:NBS-LRR type resistance protein n=1 Tax=Cucumis melo var. makuwa TaxID=1194695 RepID=A0A5D3E0B5_CUCMM|nr:NBS-LRR type resistance protein [Cucumis melo var. makuwa]TYK29158.1 NBS-LRR type resistance protein [Cucumis melo var. makuwa]
MHPYGLHASFLPLAGLPLATPLPEKLKRKRSSGSVERTHQSRDPEGCTYKSSDPKGSTYQSSDPEGSTYQSSDPEGCTYQSRDPEGCTYQSRDPEGCTYQSRDPEGCTYQSRDPKGCTYQSRDPEGYRTYKGTTTTAAPQGGADVCRRAWQIQRLKSNRGPQNGAAARRRCAADDVRLRQRRAAAVGN